MVALFLLDANSKLAFGNPFPIVSDRRVKLSSSPIGCLTFDKVELLDILTLDLIKKQNSTLCSSDNGLNSCTDHLV